MHNGTPYHKGSVSTRDLETKMREVNHLSISCKKSTEMSEVVANETDASIFSNTIFKRNLLNKVPKRVTAPYQKDMYTVCLAYMEKREVQ